MRRRQPPAFVARLNAAGSNLTYATYLRGTSASTGANAIAVDESARLAVAGFTTAGDFPVTGGAAQTAYGGSSGGGFDSDNLFPMAGDAFVTRIDLAAPPPPGARIGCEANAAGLTPNLVSPGEIVSLFGNGMGPASGVEAGLDANGRFPTSLAGVRVLFDGIAAPLLYARADQINAVAPFGLAGKSSTQIQIEYQGIQSDSLNTRVAALNPGVFTVDSSGTGQAAALNEDGTVNSPSNPARPGSIVVLFGTGAGALNPTPQDSSVIQGTPPLAPPTMAFIGAGCMGDVLYSGSAPTLVAGVIQVNVRWPADPRCGTGNVPVILLVGGAPSQDLATVSIR